MVSARGRIVQPRHHFKAHPAVVIRALPRIHLVLIVARNALSRNPPEPFAVLVIDNVFVDKLPRPVGGCLKILLAAQLVCIQESHHCLCLRPPMFIGVDHSRAIRFIQQPAILVDRLLIDGLRHLDGFVLDLGQRAASPRISAASHSSQLPSMS